MASTSMDPLTEDYRCVYCLQRLPYMVDPRQLPCSHVFCLSCLKADFAEISTTRCQICSKTHEIEDLDTLSVAGNTTTGEDKSTKLLTKVLCDVCTGHRSISITYCCDCKKHYCEEHHKMHDVILGPDHLMVSNNTSKVDTPACQTHTEEALTLACSVCHKTFCTSCDTESGCESSNGSPSGHKITKLDELAKELREEMNTALKDFSEKITEAIKVEKCAWNCLGDVETKVDGMMKDVDREAERKISEIQQLSESIKSQLKSYLLETTEETECHTTALMSNIGHWQNLWRSMSQMVKMSDLNVIQQQRKSLEVVRGSTSSALVMRKWKNPDSTLNSSNLIVDLVSPVVSHSVCPTSVRFLKKCCGTFHCVSWTNEGNLVAGGTELSVFTRNLNKLKSCPVASGPATSVSQLFPKQQQHISGGPKYVALARNTKLNQYETTEYSTLLHEGKILRCHSFSSKAGASAVQETDYPHIAINPVTSQIIAAELVTTIRTVSRPLPHNARYSQNVNVGKLRLTILSAETEAELIIDATEEIDNPYPSGLHCLPDGTVLVSFRDGNAVRKYYMDSATKKLVFAWECKDIISPTGISSDSAGHIYVGCQHGYQIKVLSPSGNLLRTLNTDFGRVPIQDVAVCGTLMAVAEGDSGLSLYNLIRQ